MTTAMNKLSELSSSNKSEVIQYLLGESQYAKKSSGRSLKDKQFFNLDLNNSQKEAINFAINESAITIIHGGLLELVKRIL